jgi:3-methyladenine DNA glycosylase AlkD
MVPSLAPGSSPRLDVTGLAQRLRAEMSTAADPARAAGMQAYMKSTMPYYGVSSPQVDAICKKVFAELSLESCGEWRVAILGLWRGARYREERYAAIRLISLKRHRECWTPELMPVLEEMIVDGAWWDYVDAVAQVVGALLRSHPTEMKPLMREWSTGENTWKRRVSIICQISFKRDTDLELLYANIEPNLADKDFFIRKAIGWSLRAYAWTNPKEVARYVREHEAQLSGLSRREALKNISGSRRG